MTQATSTSSSLLAQLTPMLSDRAVIMVVSNVDDQHLDGVSDSPAHDQVQQTRPPKRRKRDRRPARGTHRAGAGHPGPRHHLQVWIFAGRSSALVR